MIQNSAISFDKGHCPQFRLAFQSGHFSTRQALERLMGEFAELDVPRATQTNAELVLAEIFNNIVRHAYSADHIGPIHLTGTRFETELYFKIEDFGREMPIPARQAVESPHLPDCDDSLPEGGFGWFLISQLAQRHRYWRESDRNCLEVFMSIN